MNELLKNGFKKVDKSVWIVFEKPLNNENSQYLKVYKHIEWDCFFCELHQKPISKFHSHNWITLSTNAKFDWVLEVVKLLEV